MGLQYPCPIKLKVIRNANFTVTMTEMMLLANYDFLLIFPNLVLDRIQQVLSSKVPGDCICRVVANQRFSVCAIYEYDINAVILFTGYEDHSRGTERQRRRATERQFSTTRWIPDFRTCWQGSSPASDGTLSWRPITTHTQSSTRAPTWDSSMRVSRRKTKWKSDSNDWNVIFHPLFFRPHLGSGEKGRDTGLGEGGSLRQVGRCRIWLWSTDADKTEKLPRLLKSARERIKCLGILFMIYVSLVKKYLLTLFLMCDWGIRIQTRPIAWFQTIFSSRRA